MKNKTIAGLLAIFLGGFGLHWFYLDRSGLGILHLVFCWTPLPWISGLISAIVFLSMNESIFHDKYNIDFSRPDYSRFDADFERTKGYQHAPEYSSGFNDSKKIKAVSLKQNRKMAGILKKEGIQRFKNFDIEGAMDQFEKALEFQYNNPALHFNLACCQSLQENREKAYYHLEYAVSNGFSDFDRIKSHDALAYLRVDPEFSTFESNGYKARAAKQVEPIKEDLLESTPDLLEQLKKLNALRVSGQLTEESFQKEKRKLFSAR